MKHVMGRVPYVVGPATCSQISKISGGRAEYAIREIHGSGFDTIFDTFRHVVPQLYMLN